ncbi:MAG TPA: hypothetical protein VK867_00345 [Candidatus Limnocylindrales bacterium]|nr:hypothetical protein [Candidatus Limnocylindrales bacterium]
MIAERLIRATSLAGLCGLVACSPNATAPSPPAGSAAAPAGGKVFGRDPFGPDAGGTLVTPTDEIELSGFSRLFEPLMVRMVRRQYGANLGRLKAILQRRVAESQATR